MGDLTVIICSYTANDEFKLCLHQLAKYGFKSNDLLIYENSPSTYTLNRNLLKKYNIPFIDNPNGTHADSVNQALKQCKTKYALLLDSDCFCTYDPHYFVSIIKQHNLQLFGDICGSRGGCFLHKRVHPWYCFIDVEFLNKFNIPFTDFDIVKKSGSESFYNISELAKNRDKNKFYYDAGSTMYEAVIYFGGITSDIGEYLPYIHMEGSSWRSLYPIYDDIVKKQKEWLQILYNKFNYVEEQLLLFDK